MALHYRTIPWTIFWWNLTVREFVDRNAISDSFMYSVLKKNLVAFIF